MRRQRLSNVRKVMARHPDAPVGVRGPFGDVGGAHRARPQHGDKGEASYQSDDNGNGYTAGYEHGRHVDLPPIV